MTQKVFELLKACCEGKGENDFVFTREDGKQVKDFRGSWENARKAAGVPGLKDPHHTAAYCGHQCAVGREP